MSDIKPKSQKTTIPLFKGTRDRVKDFGKKGESWDSLENRMMDRIEELEAENNALKATIESMKGVS